MPKQYKIETIQDMMEIPLEKFNGFLIELGKALIVARTAYAYNQAMGYKGPTIPKPFIWLDDGKKEIRTNINWKPMEGEKKDENQGGV